jgi:hypothetical protein
MSRQRDFKSIEELAAQFGFRFAGHTGKGHLKWVNADGQALFTVSELSERRALTLIRTKFRHATRSLPGLQIISIDEALT